MNAMRLAVVAALAGLAVTAGTASAGVITAGTVYNNTAGEFGPGYSVGAMSSQSGLSAGYADGSTNFQTYTSSGVTHETSEGAVPGNNITWLSNGIPVFPFVLDWDLGSTQSIQSLALWNGTAGNNAAIQSFAVFTSNDAGFGLSTLAGVFVNPIGSAGPEPVTVFDLLDSDGRYARIQVNSYYGNSCCAGIGEVAWDVAAVAEPGSLALLGVGLAGLGALRRRKR